MADLTVSVRMPKSEITEAAHRQRQAWQGAIVHLNHLHHHRTIICTIVGTITSPSGSLATWQAGTRAPWQYGSGLPGKQASGLSETSNLASGLPGNMASGHAGLCSYYENRI